MAAAAEQDLSSFMAVLIMTIGCLVVLLKYEPTQQRASAALPVIGPVAQDAIAAYEKALDANENLPAVANNLAALLADYRSDRASFERAYELAAQFEKSDNPAFIDTLGWVYYRLGETQKALPLLEKAVDTAGQIPVLRYHLGMAYYANGQQARAREELEKAISDAGERSFTGIEDARQTLQSLN